MSEWRPYRLGEVAEVYDGPHATPAKTDQGPWYLSISSLANGRFDLSLSAHLSEEDYGRWTKRVTPRPGDTLFSYETRIGSVAHWPHAFPAALGRRMGLLRPRRDVVDPRFLTYAYMGPQFQEVLRANTVHGATVERLLIAQMPKWEMLLPSLDEQRRIAGVLGAFDDLIDADSQILRGLMEVASTAFRRAVVKSEETVLLSDIYGVGLSGVWGEDQPSQKSTVRTRVLRGRDLEDLITGVPLKPPTRYLSPKQVASRTPAVGEIWTAGSGSLGPTAPVTPDFAHLIGNGEPILYSNFVKRLVPTDDPNWYGVAWLALVHAWRQGRFSAFRTGTAMPNLDPSALLRGVEVPRLQMKARAELNEVVQAALGRELRQENRALASTRDELLPLLMSGRVTVDEAWEAVPG